jgi:hypothetical protein
MEGFPRIAAPIPLGLSNLSYALSLSACAPFRRTWEMVHPLLFAEEDDERA